MKKNKMPYIKTEEEIMNHLVEASNLFNKLEQTHPSNIIDFVDGIHKCQDVIMHRIVQRDYPEEFPSYITKIVDTGNSVKNLKIVNFKGGRIKRKKRSR